MRRLASHVHINANTREAGKFDWVKEERGTVLALDYIRLKREGWRKKRIKSGSAGKIIYFIVISKSISIDWKVAKGDVCVHDPSGSKDLLSNGPGGWKKQAEWCRKRAKQVNRKGKGKRKRWQRANESVKRREQGGKTEKKREAQNSRLVESIQRGGV